MKGLDLSFAAPVALAFTGWAMRSIFQAHAGWLGTCPQLKILRAVVTPVAVLVMDRFAWFQIAAKRLLHDKPVFQNPCLLSPMSLSTGMWISHWSRHINISMLTQPAVFSPSFGWVAMLTPTPVMELAEPSAGIRSVTISDLADGGVFPCF